jgi:hypothetical protein
MIANELIFDGDTVLVFDFDGTITDFVEDPQTSRPHKDIIKFFNKFLSQCPNSRVEIITGRLTTFMATIPDFQELITNFPGKFSINGFYGEQVWSFESDHLMSDKFLPYQHSVDETLAQVSRLLQDYLVELNAMTTSTDSPFTIEELNEIVIEPKAIAIGVHERRILKRFGIDDAINFDERPDLLEIYDQVKKMSENFSENLLQLMQSNEHGVNFKKEPGQLAFELVPYGDSIQIDKTQKFRNICSPNDGKRRPGKVYFFGDSLGDKPVFEFVFDNARLKANGTIGALDPQVRKTVLVDSSPANTCEELVFMRKNADHIVSSGDGKTAVENLAAALTENLKKQLPQVSNLGH